MNKVISFTDCEVLLWSSSKGWHRDTLPIFFDTEKIIHIGLGYAGPLHKNYSLKGLTLLPGLIDSQVHFREPGFTHKEDLETGTKAAALGGITTIFEMPNTQPATTTVELLNDKYERAKNRSHVNYAFYSGGAKGFEDEISNLEADKRSPGLKIFLGSSFGPMLVDDDITLSQILSKSQRRVTVHCEDEAILNQNKLKLGSHPSVTEHPHWRSPESCLLATQKLVHLAKKLNKKVHVLHVTTREEVDFLKKHQDTATFEVLPQHLTFYAPDCYLNLGTLVQQNPPIRELHHQISLWEAINSGLVKTLGSDHAPHTLDEKKKPYPLSPSGMPGVQTLVPIMLNHVANGKLTLERFVELMTLGVVNTFGLLNKGLIQKNFHSDFTCVDLKKSHTLLNEKMASKCGWTPFHGMTVQGYVHQTWIHGTCIMQEGEIISPPLGQSVLFN